MRGEVAPAVLAGLVGELLSPSGHPPPKGTRAHVDELEDELQHAEAERDDLQRQLAAANQRIDATNEIIRYVENERTAKQRRREASAVTRAK